LFFITVVKNKCFNQHSVSGESVALNQLRYRKSVLPFSTESRDFSLIQGVNTGFEAHPASYSVGTGVVFLEGKVTHLRQAVPHNSDMRL